MSGRKQLWKIKTLMLKNTDDTIENMDVIVENEDFLRLKLKKKLINQHLPKETSRE